MVKTAFFNFRETAMSLVMDVCAKVGISIEELALLTRTPVESVRGWNNLDLPLCGMAESLLVLLAERPSSAKVLIEKLLGGISSDSPDRAELIAILQKIDNVHA